jgi:hypothetical protein
MKEPEPRKHPEQKRAMEGLLRNGTPEGPAPGSCPDPNTLAAFPQGKLLPEEQAAVELHLTQCDRCFSMVDMLMEEESHRAEKAQGRLRGFPAWLMGRQGLAAAAVLLVAILAAAFWVVYGQGKETVPDEAETDQRLLAQIDELRRRRPALFGDFRPLTRVERLSLGPAQERGGRVILIRPRSKTLEVRPVFQWHASAGVTEVQVQLLSEDMAVLWTHSGNSSPLPYPAEAVPLAPGRTYLWRVQYATPFSETEKVIQDFYVALAAEQKAFEAAREEIDATVPDALEKLVLAHYAIRRGFLGVAEAAARDHVVAHPGSKNGRETLYHILVKQGSPEAQRIILEPKAEK